MNKKRTLDGDTLERAKEFMADVFVIPRLWIIVVLIFSIISMFEINQTISIEKGASFTLNFRITSTTVLILALIWLPPILRSIAVVGGGLKTGAGEANTPGLLKSLTDLLGVVDSAKDNLDDSQKRQVEQISQQAENQIAKSLAPDTDEARHQVLQIAQEYDSIRQKLQYGDYRTRKMNGLMTQVRAIATQANYSPKEIRTLYQSGKDGERVTALSLLRARPDPACFDLALDAIAHSRSAYEQYIALRLASEMLELLDGTSKQKLVEAIQVQGQPGPDHYLQESDSDRSRLIIAQQILRDIKKQ
jgi:hypothetical protein